MHFNFHNHSHNWGFNLESFLNFLQGGMILWVVELDWVGVANGMQTILKTILLFVSVCLAVQSFIKRNKDGEKDN